MLKSFHELRMVKEDYKSLILGKRYLGSGASKSCYDYSDGLVIKVPKHATRKIEFDRIIPKTEEELSNRIMEYNEYGLGWSYGQFLTELFVWNIALDTGIEEYINCFVPIVDAFVDTNGVPVIIQKKASQHFEYLRDENDHYLGIDGEEELRATLKKYESCVVDLRQENLGILDNRLAVLDFGVSSNSSIHDCDGYGDSDDDSFWDTCNTGNTDTGSW